MKFILSDGSKTNSHGYKVAVSGINTDRFMKNPVMLLSHDMAHVIGRWEDIQKVNNRLEAEAVFDMDDPVGKEIARKVDKDFIRSASVWIVPLKVDYIDGEYIVSESVLMEASIVSIPADEDAVRLSNGEMKELTFEQVKTNFNFNNNQFTNQKMGEQVLKLSDKTIESLKLLANPTSREVELAVAEKDREIETLKTQLKGVEKQAQTDYLNQAVKDGRITETERLSFEKMAEKGCFNDVKAVIEAKPVVATATLANQVQKSTTTSGRETWSYLQWMKDDPTGLAKLKVENPAEFERLKLSMKK